MKKIFALLPVMAFLAVACSETATTPELMEPESVVLFASVDPVLYAQSANVPCTSLYPEVEGILECKIESEAKEGELQLGNDTFICNGGSVTISNLGPGNNPQEYDFFDWTSTFDVYGVFVKGGAQGSNLYTYFETDWVRGDTELGVPNPANNSISHISFCYVPSDDYEELTVDKTVVTSFTREHFWNIDKKVETEEGYELDGEAKIWLYIDGSGDETATWTVDVTYEGYEDSDFNVSGVITIENTGTLDAVITAVDDELGDTPITVDCGVTFPYTLPVGETLTCTYDEDGYFEGFNEVTVTTERDTYFADAEIVWGNPDYEINKTVNVKDISDLFGEVALGTVTAPNGDTFTYDKAFAWADYGADGCGSFQYDNTATIVETEQSASATLKVNVQCFIYDTAYAKGDDAICFIPTFNNWGWTNPIEPGEYEWDLWAGAAQCDTNNGTLVGSVTVVYDDDGYVTVTFNVDEDYDLKEYHVYAGTTMFPQTQQGRRTVATVAPGQYYNAGPFDGSEVYVIAHAVVGYPDPDFGPEE